MQFDIVSIGLADKDTERFRAAQSLLYDSYVRSEISLSNLERTKEFLHDGLSEAYSTSINKTLEVFKDFPLWKGLGPGNGKQSYDSADEFADHIAQTVHLSAQSTIDASIFVFGYSVLDNVVTDYLRVLALAYPRIFEHYYSRKSISIERLRDQSPEKIIVEMVEGLIAEWDNQSLLYRIDRLYALMQPGPEVHGINRQRLEELTIIRNEIMHGTGLKTNMNGIDDALTLFRLTNCILFGIIKECYNLDKR